MSSKRIVCPVCRTGNSAGMAACYACGAAIATSKVRKSRAVRFAGASDGRRASGGGFRIVRSSKPES